MVVKAKYIFIKDANFRPAGGSHLGVNFKTGDVIDGVMVRNNKSSEPTNFIETITPQGKVSIGYGGRGGSVVVPYIGAEQKAKILLQGVTGVALPQPPVYDKTDFKKQVEAPTKKASSNNNTALYIGIGISVLVIGYFVYKAKNK